MTRRLEVCVDSAASLAAAATGGADRIELCSALSRGGLTPSPGLIAIAQRKAFPCHVMIRPRAGDFVYDDAELAQMEADIAWVAAAGLAGVVFGATRSRALDKPALTRLMAAAAAAGHAAGYRLSTTLHRAIDVVDDPIAAIDPAIALGFDRVLTSGGAPTAPEGRNTIRAMRARAGDAIVVMAGSGIDAGNVAELVHVGIAEVHASCARSVVTDDDAAARLGFSPPTPVTQAERVRALRDALDHA